MILAAVKAAGLKEITTLIITAHGIPLPINWTIPWIASGAGVREGTTLSLSVITKDTAATALWLLGVDAGSMQGQPITEAFY